jgi:hypothetical protein
MKRRTILKRGKTMKRRGKRKNAKTRDEKDETDETRRKEIEGRNRRKSGGFGRL